MIRFVEHSPGEFWAVNAGISRNCVTNNKCVRNIIIYYTNCTHCPINYSLTVSITPVYVTVVSVGDPRLKIKFNTRHTSSAQTLVK